MYVQNSIRVKKQIKIIKKNLNYLVQETGNLWHELQPKGWLIVVVDFDAEELVLSQFAPQEIVLLALHGTVPLLPSVGN
jgi:hypothetical protein